jgi:predicted RNase H-like HicB family nuclease
MLLDQNKRRHQEGSNMNAKNSRRKIANRYLKIVRWSDEDNCYVGMCQDLFGGGCHGQNEKKVYAELCDICEEVIEIFEEEGRPLPPPTMWQAERVPAGHDKADFEWNPMREHAGEVGAAA